MLNKKIVVLISLIGTIITIAWLAIVPNSYPINCDYENGLNCTTMLFLLMNSISVPILISGLIVYRLNESIFSTWKKMTILYVVLYCLIILVNPWLHADFSPLDKKSAFMSLVPLYFLISLSLIAYKSYQLRGK